MGGNSYGLSARPRTVLHARKNTAGTIAKGMPVYIAAHDVTDGILEVEESLASTPSTLPPIGVTYSSIEEDVNGYVITYGVLSGIDTSSYTAGAILYVDTSGGLTDSAPASNAYVVGIVLTVSATLGCIFVDTEKVDMSVVGGYSQEEIEDLIGAMVTGNTETGISVSYDDGNAKLNFDVPTEFKVNFIIDGGGADIVPGSKGFIMMPPCTITGWKILGNTTGSIVVDVKRCIYSSYPTTTSIAGSEKPTLSSEQKAEDTSLSSWTTTISDNDILEFVVDSASGLSRVTVALTCERT